MADTKPYAINQEAPKGNDTTGSEEDELEQEQTIHWKLEHTTSKNKFQDGTTGLEERIFYYGKEMQSKSITSKEALLNYIGKKYTMSEVTSLENAKMTIVGMTHPAKHTKDEFKNLTSSDTTRHTAQ
eukprot:jgi/Psemu1/61006/gm1.61006_g